MGATAPPLRRLIALTIASCLGALVLACGGDPEPQPTATTVAQSRTAVPGTPQTSSSPANPNCPVVADICAFAAAVSRNLSLDASKPRGPDDFKEVLALL